MNNQLTPETDKACDEVYAQGVAHIPLVAFMEKLERERDEARIEVQAIQHWATVNGTIQMQREIDEMRKERDEAREQWRLSSVCRIFREQRDEAISIGLDAVGQLIDLHHVTPKRDRNVEWECRADLLDRNFRKLEDLLDSFGHPEQTQP